MVAGYSGRGYGQVADEVSRSVERSNRERQRKQDLANMTPDDIQARAEEAIDRLNEEIDRCQKRIPAAKKELEYWKRVAGR